MRARWGQHSMHGDIGNMGFCGPCLSSKLVASWFVGGGPCMVIDANAITVLSLLPGAGLGFSEGGKGWCQTHKPHCSTELAVNLACAVTHVGVRLEVSVLLIDTLVLNGELACLCTCKRSCGIRGATMVCCRMTYQPCGKALHVHERMA